MSTKQERIEFATRCLNNDWPEELVEAWLYCNSRHGTPLPTDRWTKEMVHETAVAVVAAYDSDHSFDPPHRGIGQSSRAPTLTDCFAYAAASALDSSAPSWKTDVSINHVFL